MTILFADISGFTALSQRMDPDDVHETMNACFEVIGRIIDERGGTVDKYIGDCVMALFGAPKALEQAPRQALNAAIEIRNRLDRLNEDLGLAEPLGVHIGVNTGLVVAGELGDERKRDYTVISPAVNLAARLYDAASRGQIYVGRSTFRSTARDFSFRELKPLVLKGIDDPVPAYELISLEERVHKSKPVTDGSGTSSALVGREEELARLTAAFERLADGSGGVVSLVGENGLGKSRLMAEACSGEAANTVALLEGRSISTGQSLPFYPFNDLLSSWAGIDDRRDASAALASLRNALEDLDGSPAPETVAVLANLMGLPATAEEKAAIAGVAADALEKLAHRIVADLLTRLAGRAPLAVIFEDAHWADRSSLAMIEAILPICVDAPVLFVVVCRPDYPETSDRILAHVAGRAVAVSTSIRLEPLSEAHTDALIENLFATDELPLVVRDLIKRDADGNPFYIEEVIHALLEKGALRRSEGRIEATTLLPSVELPATIDEVIMSRVDVLEDEPRRLLQVASVIGRRFSRRILDRVMQAPAGELEPHLRLLTEKRFLAEVKSHRTRTRKLFTFEAEQEYKFRHALIQEGVYLSLVKRTRRALHADCASAIEAIFADRIEDAYGMLAYHYARSDDTAKAEQYLFKAGEEAARTAASAEALHYFREAYRLYVEIHGDRATDDRKALLEKNIATALLNTGNLVESIDHFDAALRLYGQWVPRSQLARWVKVGGDLSAVLLHLYARRRADGPRRDHSDEHDMFRCLYGRCKALNPTDPKRSFFDNLAAMRYLGHVDARTVENACGIYASCGSFFAFAGLSFRVAERFLRVAEELARDGTVVDRFQLDAMGFVVRFHSGQWGSEHEIDAALLEQGMRFGLHWEADTYLGMLCERNFKQGRFAAAEANLGQLRELRAAFGYEFALSNELAMRGLLRLEQRRLDEARAGLEAYHDARHEDPSRILALSGLAKVEIRAGNLGTASRHVDAAERLVRRAGQLPAFFGGAYDTARAELAVERIRRDADGAVARHAADAVKKALRTSRKIARETPEATRLAAALACLRGDARAAERLWRDAIATCERLAARPELAWVYRDIALLGGDRTSFEGTGAEQWAARAQALLAELGIESEGLAVSAAADTASGRLTA